MRWFVDGWSPAYGASFEAGGPSDRSSAAVDPEIEVPAGAWRPLTAPPSVRVPDVVLLVDGVRRIDATLWTAEDDGSSFAGLAASYAAGVVRCDLRRGVAEPTGCRVARGLFTASPSAADVVAGSVRYPVQQVRYGEPEQLAAAVQKPLTELEVAVSGSARSGDELLVVDGPLRNRRQLPGTIGYVKTQHQQYLPAALGAVVPALRAGERTPVFTLGTRWNSYSWYLRLPGPAGAPWAGIVRVECSVEWTVAEAVALADLSAVTLPRFAATAYKDPRAPQNLVPIAGLERRLRAMLGDPRLLHRALTIATSRAGVRDRDPHDYTDVVA
jgi:uncharacterized protein